MKKWYVQYILYLSIAQQRTVRKKGESWAEFNPTAHIQVRSSLLVWKIVAIDKNSFLIYRYKPDSEDSIMLGTPSDILCISYECYY